MHRPGEPVDRPSLLDRLLDAAVAGGVTVLILVGFATSYRTLLDLAATVGGYPNWLAPAVPLSFDLGIVVLSLKIAQAAREGRRAPVLRLLVIGLSTATVAVNASAAEAAAARLLHAVPPAMFVICFESVVITVRRHALQARGAWPDPIPRQHPLRWLLAPRSTSTTWRQAVLGSPSANSSTAIGDTSTEPRQGPSLIRTDAAERDVAQVGTREGLITSALERDRTLSAPALRALLLDEGFEMSLRTVQRLRAAVLTDDGRHRRLR